MNELEELTERLRAGLASSMQGSYQRRLPAKKARPDLLAARAGLRDLAAREPSLEALRALSLAEEAFLNYPAAVEALELALSMSAPPDRRDLKRLFLLRESASKWQSLSLSPEELAALGRFLDSRLATQPCDHTLRHTKEWLTQHKAASIAKVIRGIESSGCFCDCEVVFNAV